ncbi:MAG: hypothetical protein FJZ49_06130 [Candidatus Verstraetearchaeota archaeon]|nr:hypothetical protein [Candidatus Verstraetearchaeota archaeon]
MMLLLVGCEERGRMLKTLSSHGYEVISYSTGGGEGAHDLAKGCDILFVCSDVNRSRLIADDIWHLLRNKLVISLTEGMNLSALKDLYPLSKVSRCSICVDVEVERSLFLLSADASYSDRDLTAIKEILGRLGEPLLVKEEMLEALNRRMEASAVILSELIAALRDSIGEDRDLYEYVLGWVLYGIGAATIGGSKLWALLPERSAKLTPDVKEKIRKAVLEALSFYGIKERRGGGR